MRSHWAVVWALAGLLSGAPARAQERGPRGGPPGPGLVEPKPGEKIAWYGTLEQARAEARRLNRPIFLMSAAPHCHNISGIW